MLITLSQNIFSSPYVYVFFALLSQSLFVDNNVDNFCLKE